MPAGRWTRIPAAAALFVAILGVATSRANAPAKQRARARRAHDAAAITVAMPPGSPIGKGPMVLLTRTDDPAVLTGRVDGFVMIYSAVGIRDDTRAGAIAAAMGKNPFAPLRHARLDQHDAGVGCWMHQPGFCLSLE